VCRQGCHEDVTSKLPWNLSLTGHPHWSEDVSNICIQMALTFLAVFGLKNSLCSNSEIVRQFMHANTNSRVLFQKWSKSAKRPRWFREKKHVLAPLGRTPRAIPPFFTRVRTVAPHLYSTFYQDPFRVGGTTTEKKTSPRPPAFRLNAI